MIQGQRKKPILSKYIFELISQEQIYANFFQKFELDKLYSSPFRRDTTPSFVFYKNAEGKILYHDFGKELYRGDCIDFVRQLHSLSYVEALKMIDVSFNLGLWSPKLENFVIPEKFELPITPAGPSKTLIQFEHRPFVQKEVDFWNQFGLSEKDLKKEDVYAVKSLWINKVKLRVVEGTFAYLFRGPDEEFVKIYSPLGNPNFKFITNAPKGHISGKDKLPFTSDTLIITKSKKDELVLKHFHTDVCSVQSESIVSISVEDIQFFKSKYKRVIVNFDPDPTGVEACKYYNQFGFSYINIEKSLWKKGIKDFADMYRELGSKYVEAYLKRKGL